MSEHENVMHKTLYIPSVKAQHKVWRNDILHAASKCHTVIQMGNLLSVSEHITDTKKRDAPNAAILALSDEMSQEALEYITLMGPHEMLALNNPDVWTNQESKTYLLDMWSDPQCLQVATESHGRLVSHGGLTYGQWVSLDRPQTATDAAQRLNQKYRGVLYCGPSVKLGNRPNYAADPIWADHILELYPSWIGAPESCPFDQVHASGDLNTQEGRRLLKDDSSPIKYVDSVNLKRYGSQTVINEALFTGVDLQLSGQMLMPSLKNSKRLRTLYIEEFPQETPVDTFLSS